MAIEKSYLINAPVSKVWQALVDPNLIEKWGGGPVEMRAEVGAEFTLWGDYHGGPLKDLVEDQATAR